MFFKIILCCIGLYLVLTQVNSTPVYKGKLEKWFLTDPAPSNQTITDATLKSAIEFAQMLMSSSYSIPNKNFTYTNQDNFVQVNISEGSVTDPSKFTVDKAHVNMSTLEFQVHLTFPSINVTGQYFLNASTDTFKVFGKGPFRLNTTGVETEIDITLAQHQNNTLYLKDINFDYNVTTTNVRVDGLLNDTEACNLMNDLINEFVPDALHDFKPDIDSEGAILAEKYSAFLFSNITLPQLIKFINGLAG